MGEYLTFLAWLVVKAMVKRYNNCRKLSVPEAKRSDDRQKSLVNNKHKGDLCYPQGKMRARTGHIYTTGTVWAHIIWCFCNLCCDRPMGRLLWLGFRGSGNVLLDYLFAMLHNLCTLLKWGPFITPLLWATQMETFPLWIYESWLLKRWWRRRAAAK